MTRLDDVLKAPASGYNYIDALLAPAPNWNYLTDDGVNFRTTLSFSFDTNGTQYEAGVQPFTELQQLAVRQVLGYVHQVTGIRFSENPAGETADIRFAMADLANPELDGVCYAPYNYAALDDGTLLAYDSNTVVYLDTKQPANFDLQPGSWGYQTLLHEVGHALGLKHPSDSYPGAETTLDPLWQNNTEHTIMSYNQAGPYATSFAPLDLAALQYLYGGDGLRGNWGVATDGVWITGSPLNDYLVPPKGKSILYDAGGVDVVGFDGLQTDYIITPTTDKQWLLVRGNQYETLVSAGLEYLDFNGELVPVDALLNPVGSRINGYNGNDMLSGTAGNDLLFGFEGDDLLISNGGDDLIFGGYGFDTAVMLGSLQDAVFSRSENPDIWSLSTRFGNSILVEVEQVMFDDGIVRLDQAGLETINLAGLQQDGVVQFFG